uniref:Solute carrier family 7 (Cationic amino acid transporter, y+ system), member 2 [Ciona intestinalis] n=1 Tax=Lepeophtheirus salmonis TaxID=72036 RepID=A0A0K2U7Y3_LEPSM|nr:high affinity cationic amino acid transporter 1-like isoform X2 [Lepeophtheirus salmonis]
MKYFEEFLRRVKRKKIIETNTPSQLKKCLRLFDLTALGVGSTLGVGIYILSGQISKTEAGPGVVISFLIAAIASFFSGLSYAEFGARVPKAGSAYIYSYVCVGEFIAFIIGWSMLLSYGIGASSVAKGFTKNLNSITNGKVEVFLENFPLVTGEIFEKNLDIISFLLIMVLTIILALGVKESTIINNLLTTVNIAIVLFVFIAGGINVNFENWNISMEELKNNYTNDCPLCTEENNCVSEEYDTVCGSGGFFPYGFSGIIKGAGTAFYGFVGFDVIATLGEEVINPKRDIPLSIILALLCVFISYFGVSSIVTLCLPYFMQDSDAPLPKVFESIGLNWAVIIIQIGAFFGLFASLIGALIPLPRVIWAMASDGLVFKFLSKVHLKFQTPIYATLISGSIAAIMAAIFNLQSLVDLMSIGTLLGYTMVSTCILILRNCFLFASTTCRTDWFSFSLFKQKIFFISIILSHCNSTEWSCHPCLCI